MLFNSWLSINLANQSPKITHKLRYTEFIVPVPWLLCSLIWITQAALIHNALSGHAFDDLKHTMILSHCIYQSNLLFINSNYLFFRYILFLFTYYLFVFVCLCAWHVLSGSMGAKRLPGRCERFDTEAGKRSPVF